MSMQYSRIWSDIASSESGARMSKMAHLAFPVFTATAVDSWGRCMDRLHVILAEMFRSRSDFSKKEIAGWLDEWEREGWILRYSTPAGGAIQVVNFEARQPDRVAYRRKIGEVERIPAPDGYAPAAPKVGRPRKDCQKSSIYDGNSDRQNDRQNDGGNSTENPAHKNKDKDKYSPPTPQGVAAAFSRNSHGFQTTIPTALTEPPNGVSQATFDVFRQAFPKPTAHDDSLFLDLHRQYGDDGLRWGLDELRFKSGIKHPWSVVRAMLAEDWTPDGPRPKNGTGYDRSHETPDYMRPMTPLPTVERPAKRR